MEQRASSAGPDEKRFGRYRVVESLGTGAMGTVYRAHDEVLGRDVAIKVLHGSFTPLQDEMSRARFENEARAVAALAHPGVVPVFDVGFDGDMPYLVMQLVAGGSLADRIDRGERLEPEAARRLGVQVAHALAAAHAKGIVHRDVKPANVLGDETGWKLADFGVARVPDSSLTLPGQFLGSPAYAAPEALTEGELTAASDVYALGATLYEALCGQPPYGPRGVLSPGVLGRPGPPVPVTSFCPAAAGWLADAVMAALAWEPSHRPGAAQLAGRLEGLQPAMPVPPRRGGLWLAVAGGAVLLLLGIVIGASGDDPVPASGTPLGAAEDRRGPERGGPPPHARGRGGGDEAERWREIEEHWRKGKVDKVRKELDEMLERDPSNQRARELLRQLDDAHMAEHWREVDEALDEHEYEDAVEELEKILDDDPGNPRAAELLDQLRRYDYDD